MIAVLERGSSQQPYYEATQVEKVLHETATNMLESLRQIHQVGPSLGSFTA